MVAPGQAPHRRVNRPAIHRPAPSLPPLEIGELLFQFEELGGEQ